MKTLKILVMVLFSIFMFVHITACSDKDESINELEGKPKVGKLVFILEGKTASAGDTIHVVDKIGEFTLSWKREDGSVTDYDYAVSLYSEDGPIYIENSHNGYKKISWDYPGIGSIKVQDPYTDEFFNFYIVVDELNYKEQFKITYADQLVDLNGITHKGPFLGLKTDKNIGSSRITVVSFGCDDHIYKSNGSWSTFVDCDLYYGEMSIKYIIGEPNYYFYIFKYGDKTHEVRLYKDGRGYLWDGEWEK